MPGPMPTYDQLKGLVDKLEKRLAKEKKTRKKFEDANKELMGEEIKDYKEEYKLTVSMQSKLREKQDLLNRFFKLRDLVDQQASNLARLNNLITGFGRNLKVINRNAGELFANEPDPKLAKENERRLSEIQGLGKELRQFLKDEHTATAIYRRIKELVEQEMREANEFHRKVKRGFKATKNAHKKLESDLVEVTKITEEALRNRRSTT